jgi:hypothetical protein
MKITLFQNFENQNPTYSHIHHHPIYNGLKKEKSSFHSSSSDEKQKMVLILTSIKNQKINETEMKGRRTNKT